jgi:heme exporter protein D
MQFVREQNKFVAKFGSLTTEQASSAKSQRINKEILANATNN